MITSRHSSAVAACGLSLALFFTGMTTASAEDAVGVLIRRQTESFSDASARNDVAGMNGMLDDDILFSNGDGTVQRDEQRDKADAVSALLKRQTQAFLEAGQHGDKAALARYLDPKVIFIDENGMASDARNFRGGAPALPPKGASSTLAVTDWVLHRAGDVAVASFIDDQTIQIGGQVLRNKFLAVETWYKRGATWKLIGSQTIPLNQDPSRATLADDALTEYPGTYTAGPGATATIARDGDALTLSTNGAKPAPFVAEFRDVFFTPSQQSGYPRQRLIFQRDAGGQVTGYISRARGVGNIEWTKAVAAPGEATADARRSTLTLRDFTVHHAGDVAVATFLHDKVTEQYGQVAHTIFRTTEAWIKRGSSWKMIASQGCELQPDPPTLTLPAGVLNEYIGTYAAPGVTIAIARSGAALTASTNGAEPIPLDAESRDMFFTPGRAGGNVIFQRDASGRVTTYISRQAGGDLVFTAVTG
jgi:ketosteroid isomerase-like protein